MSTGRPRFEPVTGSTTVAAAVVCEPVGGGLASGAVVVRPGAMSGLVPCAWDLTPPVGSGGRGGSDSFTPRPDLPRCGRRCRVGDAVARGEVDRVGRDVG